MRESKPDRLLAALERDLAALAAAGLKRSRRTLESAPGARVVVDGRQLVAFASNDYLGLANHPDVVAAARDGAARWGTGAAASHLVCGHFAPHAALEAELAAFVGPCEEARALTFSSGYLANLAILTALAGRSDAVFADRLNHACLNDGALLSRAELVRYPHGDVAALARRLAASTAKRKVIATDAVFSMDGDIAPLPALLSLAEEHDAWLVVDDAHGFGVLGDGAHGGRGTLAHFGLASERIVYMGTLGKAAGVAGAFVAAHRAVIETLLATARSYVFTTAAPPMLAEALRASLRVLARDHARRARLHELIGRFRDRMRATPWTLLPSATPIQPVVVGDNATAMALAAALWDRGFWVPAIRPPTVPVGTARLRITLTAAHSDDDVDALADAFADLVPAFR
jgi:8-amino-7-oxononanoate synthase